MTLDALTVVGIDAEANVVQVGGGEVQTADSFGFFIEGDDRDVDKVSITYFFGMRK